MKHDVKSGELSGSLKESGVAGDSGSEVSVDERPEYNGADGDEEPAVGAGRLR